MFKIIIKILILTVVVAIIGSTADFFLELSKPCVVEK